MNGHVFVITGAGRGIGLELTKLALQKGAQVFAGVRNPEQATELMNLAHDGTGSKLKIFALDVTDDESTKAFVRQVAKSAPRVDVLINNAGVYLDQGTTAATTSTEVYLESLQTNTLGPIRVTSACIELLKKASKPVVANITSLMGSIADNGGGASPAYRMSKTALNSFSKTLSIDEPKLTVLSLHPGWVRTSMGGKGAPLEPQTSAAGLMNVIIDATPKQSGHFINYNGKELPW